MLNLLTKKCAEMHHDVHVRKMIVETAQILSTAHRVLDGKKIRTKTDKGRAITRYEIDLDVYKASNVNHPCCIWVRQSILNYAWAYELFVNLCKEYTYRFDKTHLSETKLMNILKHPPTNIPKTPRFTSFPKAMPEEYISTSVVDSYIWYYSITKAYDKNDKFIGKYTKRTNAFF